MGLGQLIGLFCFLHWLECQWIIVGIGINCKRQCINNKQRNQTHRNELESGNANQRTVNVSFKTTERVWANNVGKEEP